MTNYNFRRGDDGSRVKTRRRPTPYSRRPQLGALDKRTHEGRLFASFQAGLTQHVGGSPSATQKALIERASWLRVRLAVFDDKLAAGAFTELDSRTYLAWSNSLTRTLAHLGLAPAAGAQPTLSEVLADIANRRSPPVADDDDAEAAE